MRVVGRVHGERLRHGQVPVYPGRLQHDADVWLQGVALMARVVAEHGHAALVTVAVALEDFDRRRLAGAVRPEQGEDLAPGYLEVHSVDRLQGAVGLAQAAHQHRRFLVRGASDGCPAPRYTRRCALDHVICLPRPLAGSPARGRYRRYKSARQNPSSWPCQIWPCHTLRKRDGPTALAAVPPG